MCMYAMPSIILKMNKLDIFQLSYANRKRNMSFKQPTCKLFSFVLLVLAARKYFLWSAPRQEQWWQR